MREKEIRQKDINCPAKMRERSESPRQPAEDWLGGSQRASVDLRSGARESVGQRRHGLRK